VEFICTKFHKNLSRILDSTGRKLFPSLNTVWQKQIFTNFDLAGQLWYKQFHENSIQNTNGLTDGRTVWSEREAAFYFEKKPTITKLQIKNHRVTAGNSNWTQPRFDSFNALGHPCTKDVPTSVSAFCRWPIVLQLAWPYCCGQSPVRYTLSAHNCTAHCRTAVAVHKLLSFTQSLSEGST